MKILVLLLRINLRNGYNHIKIGNPFSHRWHCVHNYVIRLSIREKRDLCLGKPHRR